MIRFLINPFGVPSFLLGVAVSKAADIILGKPEVLPCRTCPHE